ncbi:MerR family transcriptional regulator [Kineococcus terrestris]|uniref:MerR family transcriptional regulator n=1 Tax=Kineococcus terrestris TaxID=2044856 RepID=UPI0034DB694F
MLVRLAGGEVLLSGSAVLDVLRALLTAERVAAADGIAPSRAWRWLSEEFRQAAADVQARNALTAGGTATRGSAEVPQLEQPSPLRQDLIETKEAARMLGCTPRNVRDLAQRGVLDSGRQVAGRLLLERTEVAALAQHRIESRRTA